MTKLTFVAAALVAAAAYSAEASATARGNGASRHNQAATTASTDVNCVRAPNVGAFASAAYSSPPCMPGTAN
jgi:hypothetical protein